MTAVLLQKNWNGNLTVKLALDNIGIKSGKDVEVLRDLVRFPVHSSLETYQQAQELDLLIANRTDLNIMPLSDTMELTDLIKLVEFSKTSAIFSLDSQNENALV